MEIEELLEELKGEIKKDGKLSFHSISAEFLDQKGKLSLAIMPTRWKNDTEKGIIRTGLKAKLKELKVKKYWFCTEMWVSQVDYASPDKPYVKPHRDINRQEAVAVFEYNEDRTKNQSRIAFFRRTNTGIEFYEQSTSAKAMQAGDSLAYY